MRRVTVASTASGEMSVGFRILTVFSALASVGLIGGLITESVQRQNQAAASPSLQTLSDVQIINATLESGDVLAFNETTQLWSPTQQSLNIPTRLQDLTDVAATTASDNDALFYDAAEMVWKSQKIQEGNVEPSSIQLRVIGSCAAQSQIRVIHPSGQVECDASVGINAVGTGQIVDGSVTFNKVDATTIQRRITGSCPLGFHINAVTIDGDTICDETVAANQVGSAQIVDGVVGATKIDSAQVQRRISGVCPSGAQISGINQDGTVACDTAVAPTSIGAAQMTSDAIATSSLQDGAVTANKIASQQVQKRVNGTCPVGSQVSSIGEDGSVICDATVTISENAITLVMLQPDSIDSTKIVDNTIVEADMSAEYKRAVPNGIATLDADGFIPTSQLPPITVTNVITCPNITCRNATETTVSTGDVVIVLDRGDGNPDTYIWTGDEWVVFQTTGVTITSTDEVPEGSTNLYYTDGRVSANVDVTANTGHRNTVTGNPHQLGLNDLLDVDTVSGGSPQNGQTLVFNSGSANFEVAFPVGEANTATNVGSVDGAGIFKQKNGADLEFRKLSAGSNKFIITPSLNEITLDVNSSAILELVAPTQLVDHTTVILSGANGIDVSGPGDISASRTITFTGGLQNLADIDDNLTPLDGQVLVYNLSANVWTNGRRTTGTNVGGGTGNVFKQFNNNVLELRSLQDAGNNRVSIGTTLNTITLDVQEGSVNHDSLMNYDADRHIDHAAVILSGANGITVSGSGDLTGSRVLSRDVNVIQSRVTGTCAVGQIVTAIASDGTVTCHQLVGGAGINVAAAGTTVTLSTIGVGGELSFFSLTDFTVAIGAVTTGANNFVEVLPTTTLTSVGASSMDQVSNGRLRYTGIPTVVCRVTATVTSGSNGNLDRRFILLLAVNGAPVLSTRTVHQLNDNLDAQVVVTSGMVQMATNQYVSVFVGNTLNTQSFLVNSLQIHAECR